MPSFKHLVKLNEKVLELNHRLKMGDSSAELELEVLKIQEPRVKHFCGYQNFSIEKYFSEGF
jgi:hypothetical protein